MRPPRTLTAYLLLGLASAGLLADNAFVTDPEPDVPASVRPGQPWREATVELPPWPEDADLLELTLDGPPSPFRYFVDSRNLGVGPDEVVRYTLVAEGRNGARNLSVEGIRCTPKGRYKVFAYGSGGRLDAVEDADWRPISSDPGERHRQDLWRHHLCVPLGFKPRPKADMIRSLRGRLPPRQNMGFQAD